jgi:hypothetical protein
MGLGQEELARKRYTPADRPGEAELHLRLDEPPRLVW